jgi:hypothetical protein
VGTTVLWMLYKFLRQRVCHISTTEHASGFDDPMSDGRSLIRRQSEYSTLKFPRGRHGSAFGNSTSQGSFLKSGVLKLLKVQGLFGYHDGVLGVPLPLDIYVLYGSR